MENLNYKIIEFDLETISDELLNKYFDFDDHFSFELDPEDEPWPNELKKQQMQTVNPERKSYRWLVITVRDEQVIGYARIRFVTELANNNERAKNFANVEITVDKEHRRQSIGTKLFKKVCDKALEQGEITTITIPFVYDIGHKFCEKFKGKVVQKEAEYRAYFSKIDWLLMEQWKNKGEKMVKKEGVTLEQFEHCPEHLIEKYADIYTETVNQRPLGDISVRHRITPESRRNHEKLWIEDRGHKWYTFITKEADGSISGLTEMVYIVESPYYIEQLLTGVREQYRGRGLGKWLKAEMALFIKNQYPEIKFIQTSNADMNDP
ncbi:MAG: GNAT family N-acetyltransferase, partial [Candidatus Heimdallarchaeota archaeon]